MEFDGAIFLMSKMFLDRKKGILEHAQDVVNILTFGNFLDASNFLKCENCCTEICKNSEQISRARKRSHLEASRTMVLDGHQKSKTKKIFEGCGFQRSRHNTIY